MPGSASRLRERVFLFFIIAGFVLGLVVLLLQCHDLVDDAYISARYARNLVQGYGLVYNRGEALERVEGYSNFLWVLLLALGLKLGLSIKFTAQALGVVSGLLSLLVIFLWLKQETQSRWLALLAGYFLASNIYFAIWQVEGLESGLFGFLLLAGIYAFSKNHLRRAMLLCLLASLTRPDGILLFFVIAGVQIFRSGKKLSAQKQNLKIWLWFIVPYLGYFLFRAIYYQSLFPNTFYAKTGLGWLALREGLFYFKSFFLKNPHLLPLYLLLLYALARLKKFSPAIQAGLILVGIYSLFIFLVGGDWMPGFRFLVHIFPLLCGCSMIAGLELARDLKYSLKSSRQIVSALFMIMVAGNLYAFSSYSLKDSFEKSWHREQSKWYLPTARWLKTYVWQNQSIALGDIGYIGYFGDHHRIIDTMGLVDRHLGRLKGISSMTTDLDYIFSQNPFCIVSLVHHYPNGAWLGHSEFDRKLAQDARFKEKYRLVKEIYGWHSVEISRTDWKKRQSEVFFRIYFRNHP